VSEPTKVGQLSSRAERAFRPIQYLGNKTRLLEDIAVAMESLVPVGARVGDLFSGTSVVGRRLSSRNPVTAVDVQAYAEVLGRTMLLGDPSRLRHLDEAAFRQRFSDARSRLREAFRPDLDRERAALEALAAGDATGLHDLVESGSPLARAFASASMEVSATSVPSLGELPDATATLTFGGVYFSFEQAITLDALAHAISFEPPELKPMLTSAMLGACSEAVNTVGKQFAQPMRVLDRAGRPKPLLVSRTLRDRALDVEELFRQALARWASAGTPSGFEHRVVRGPVEGFLAEEHGCAAFYADPPYTIDHYSRFYHVLETLVLRDQPSLARMRKGGVVSVMRGLYREDRYQSDFCIPSRAPGAFDRLLSGVAARGAQLLLSYSGHATEDEQRPRLLSVDALVGMARQHFRQVSVEEPRFEGHRKLNASRRNSVTERHSERFIVCRS
jgi:adenine-specific DNA-methyltransferase